ncbi:TetR/AcrR family transcriptional regulator [Bacteroidota bacterium]
MPRTEEQFQGIREKSRSLILQTALKLFAQKGYHGTSIADIAKEAGISKGLAYNYFGSKLELIEAVIQQLEVEVGKMFVDMETLSDPYDKLKFFIEVTLNSIRDNEEFWLLYFGISLQKDVLAISQRLMGNFIEEVFKMLEELFAEIGIKEPYTEARIFASILDGIGVHYVYNKAHYPLEEVKLQLIKKYSPEGLSHLKK